MFNCNNCKITVELLNGIGQETQTDFKYHC